MAKRLTKQDIIDRLRSTELVLAALRDGVAEMDPKTAEFRFRGMRYSCGNGNWPLLVKVIGSTALQNAVIKASGKRTVYPQVDA